MTRTQTALVGAGGAAGAVLRWALTTIDAGTFPWPTLLANVAGAALLGALLGPLLGPGPGSSGVAGPMSALSQNQRALLATGFCGGLTTFSTLSVEVAQLVSSGDSGDMATGWAYLAVSLLTGLLAFVGARSVTSARAVQP